MSESEIKYYKKLLNKQKWKNNIASVCVVFVCNELLWFLYDIVAAPQMLVFIGIIIAVFGAAAGVLYHSIFTYIKKIDTDNLDADTGNFINGQLERYLKRTINCIALVIFAVVAFVILEVSFYINGNSKLAELIENMFANAIFVEVPLFLLIKNYVQYLLFTNLCKRESTNKRRKHMFGVLTASILYWNGIIVSIYLLDESIPYPANMILLGGLCYGLLLLLYNLTLRRKITRQNIVINKQRIAIYVSVCVVLSGYWMLQKDTWYTQTYINSVPVVEHSNNEISYNEETGVYTIVSDKEDFKILHLTDIHLGGSLYSYQKDLKALQACFDEIEYTKPDLVVVTGDMCFPLGIMSMSFNNTSAVHQFAAFMRNTGIPWCFTYGNHDTESLASAGKQELNDVYMSLSYKTSKTLLYPYIQPDIMGRNNQLIEVRNSDGTLNTALFLIDSNAYTGEGINVYDYIHDDQVEWYADEVKRLNQEEGKMVSSMAFFHIPLQEYRTAYELYESGSDEVTYYFGSNDEKMIDKICCSDYPSKLFDTMLELGSTKAVFCGHDHYNNMSLEYKGIRLTYGMSIDYLAMPGIEKDTKQRGAELITLHRDSSWDVEQIPLESIQQ